MEELGDVGGLAFDVVAIAHCSPIEIHAYNQLAYSLLSVNVPRGHRFTDKRTDLVQIRML